MATFISCQTILVDKLRERGWAVVSLEADSLTSDELWAVNNWEQTFGEAFALGKTEKEASGPYRTECGVSVGYRVDSEREFFESRLHSDGACEPSFPRVVNYDSTVKNLYSALNKAARPALKEVAAYMGVDAQMFFDLTDIDTDGVLPRNEVTNKATGEKVIVDNLSSSLLRICKYQDALDDYEAGSETSLSPDTAEEGKNDPFSTPTATGSVWFGAHTDSSLLTISLCSSTPGLDIVDQLENKWVAPELLLREQKIQEGPLGADRSAGQGGVYVMMFVGEFLQVLSKHRFKAAVHRVRNFGVPSSLSPSSADASTADPAANGADTSHTDESRNQRISCPYLIRGRHGAIFDIHNADKYTHPGGLDAVSEELVPNLDGTSVKMMHKLLDLKRQRCFRENGSAEGSTWVLSAYPVPPLPQETERISTFL
jgi:isopenicillin N synthase-like dioxygenase